MCDLILPFLIIGTILISVLIALNIKPVQPTNELDFIAKLISLQSKSAFDAWDAQVKYRFYIFIAFATPLALAILIWTLTNNLLCK